MTLTQFSLRPLAQSFAYYKRRIIFIQNVVYDHFAQPIIVAE